MKNRGFAEIETERLLLRRLRPSDWKVVSYLRSDKEVNAFVKRPIAAKKATKSSME
jgi:[ribosomal protein S5]-alanine N-acetyltransferase